MAAGGFSSKRLARVRDVLERHVDAGHGPGAVAVVARHGEVHIEATGNLAFEGEGSRTPMAADTICRITSWTKPIVAACAMTLVEDCTLRLNDPVDALLPELANMTVLADPNGPLDDTVPAKRPITLRDLLTCRLGTGTVLAEPGTVPISDALNALERGDGPDDAGPSPDEWIRRLGRLPLVYQSGERWMYYIPAIALGVLIARATGMPLEDVLRERICEPLGMKDTALSVGGESVSRLATAYVLDEATGEFVVAASRDGLGRQPPTFKAAASGLVSTADDFLAFASALLAGGTHRGRRVLSRPSVTLMTSDHLTQRQKMVSKFVWPPGFFEDFGWGFGMGINTRRTYLGPSVGSYGWYGKYGTTWFNDPAEDMTTILFAQTEWWQMPIFHDFWTAAYQAIDD
ncbi:serine hydrolase domain-containing protein [Actinocrispum wychmicini]|uniref:CubicO group peptidase (Beta-lactamase class C family) n=1 Tax=Actinocrispum wychmicini TaxID=1213861 RepID=A0A4R2JYZ0_9PSEU|nr:serine hydrolase domain-containing protein [Actinocrispum wychmicini]TCO59335.1 CubicO group peptidase (beta-lactamase class C family) [Actinocrispum wychmicini]